MKTIKPYFSCIIDESEMDGKVEFSHPVVFIQSNDGKFFRQENLADGRYARVEVTSIPKLAESEVQQEISFLPAGKIPYELFEQAMEFFKQAMTIEKNNSKFESMLHILWNKTDGYHIGVPTQIVAPASVKYEFDHKKPGDVIVLDWHSHDSMGAFFSGTDNADDKASICYSGVVGKLDTPNPEFVWRFNINKDKIPANLGDIFHIPSKDVSIPKEWLAKVQVHKPAPIKPMMGTQNPARNTTYNSWFDEKDAIQNSWKSKRRDMWHKGSDREEQVEQSYSDVEAQWLKMDEINEAKEQIEIYLDDLKGSDKHIVEIIRYAKDLLSGEGMDDLNTWGL